MFLIIYIQSKPLMGVKGLNMLGIAALIFIVILVLRLQTALKNNKTGFVEHGVPEKNYTVLIVSLWLYLIPLLILVFPVNPLIHLLYPLPLIVLFIIPGIVNGRRAGAILSTSGIDIGVNAGRTAENVMWLGVGSLLFVLGNWGFGIFELYLEQHFDSF